MVIAGESNLKVEFYLNGEWSGEFSNSRSDWSTISGHLTGH